MNETVSEGVVEPVHMWTTVVLDTAMHTNVGQGLLLRPTWISVTLNISVAGKRKIEVLVPNRLPDSEKGVDHPQTKQLGLLPRLI